MEIDSAKQSLRHASRQLTKALQQEEPCAQRRNCQHLVQNTHYGELTQL